MVVSEILRFLSEDLGLSSRLRSAGLEGERVALKSLIKGNVTCHQTPSQGEMLISGSLSD